MTTATTRTALEKDYFVALETWSESIASWRAELPALGGRETLTQETGKKYLCRSFFNVIRSSS